MRDLQIRKVACLGSGTIGHSWATLFAVKGFSVVLQDTSKSILDNAMRRIEMNMNTLKEKSVINDDEKAKALRGISRVVSIEEAVREADLVQESIYETYAAKKEVFVKAERASRSRTIFASSSSYLLPSEIQKALSNPERFIVAHPYNPPHLVPLVELVPGQATSLRTIDDAFQFYKSLGKFPIVIKKELWGYIGNRLQDALAKEALDIVNSGVASIEDVDMVLSTGPGIRWSIYGIGLQGYFNSFSSVFQSLANAPGTNAAASTAEKAEEGMKNYSLLKGKTFDEMIRWRDRKLIDVLRTLGWIPEPK